MTENGSGPDARPVPMAGDQHPKPALLRTLLVVWLAWTVWGFLMGSRYGVIGLYNQREFPAWLPFALSLPPAWFWAAATPPVLWMTRRFPLRIWPSPLTMIAHTALAAAIVTLDVSLDLALSRAFEGEGQRSYGFYFIGQLNANLLQYFVLLAFAALYANQEERRKREVRAAQLETQLANAQLSVLKSQFQPHFLFNALNTISELYHQAPAVADTMMSRFGDLLRMSMEQTDQEVTLGEELEMLRRYVEIQEARFSGRLHVCIQVSEPLTRAKVPSFILQPLVENSIKHGVAKRHGVGRIKVRAERAGGQLVLDVIDNGPGIPADRKLGIGTANTSARLRHLYGADCALQLSNNDETGGATARITLPLQFQEDPFHDE